MSKQSIAEKVIYQSRASIEDRNEALVFVRKQAARIVELETALEDLVTYPGLKTYLPGAVRRIEALMKGTS